MTEDIVARLREHLKRPEMVHTTHWDGCMESHSICALAWALDKIERLQADRDRWHDIANQLATHIEKVSSSNARALQDYDNRVYEEVYGD